MFLGYLLHFLPPKLFDTFRRFVVRCPLVIQAIIIVAVVYIVVQIKSSDVQPFITSNSDKIEKHQQCTTPFGQTTD